MSEHLEYRRPRVQEKTSPPARAREQLFDDLTTSDLAEVLREASRIQESRELATLDQALETARELGIDEKHVVAAAEKVQREKARRARLRTVTRRRRAEFLHFFGLMLVISTFVLVAAGAPPAQMTLFGMSIAAFIMAVKWAQAWAAEKKPDLVGSDGMEPGDCRVCGRAATSPRGHYCREHEPGGRTG